MDEWNNGSRSNADKALVAVARAITYSLAASPPKSSSIAEPAFPILDSDKSSSTSAGLPAFPKSLQRLRERSLASGKRPGI